MFKDILKELRKESHLSQKNLADLLGVSPQAYQKYEYGINDPNTDALCKIADFYNVTTDYLLGREEKPVCTELSSDDVAVIKANLKSIESIIDSNSKS